jgi:hypothetical protein
MVLHCAARLGLISQLYENKTSIALFLGIIKEIPITTCSSENDFSTTLSFPLDDSDNLPVTVANPDEINLFFQHPCAIVAPMRFPVRLDNGTFLTERTRSAFPDSVFHPPSIS